MLSISEQVFFPPCQGGAPAHISSALHHPPPLRSSFTTTPILHRAALHSLALRCASPPHWLAEPVGLAQLLLPPAFSAVRCCCCCCCCLVSTYADERRRHIPPSLLLEGRFQFAFTFLLAGTIGFRAVPVNSPPFPSPELSSNSSETSGRRRVLDSPSPSACSPRQPVMEISPKSI